MEFHQPLPFDSNLPNFIQINLMGPRKAHKSLLLGELPEKVGGHEIST
jgi:hypothetical protein